MQITDITRWGKKDRYFLDPQVIIQIKISVNPSKYPSSKPSKIASVPEEKRAKRSLVQHTIKNELD